MFIYATVLSISLLLLALIVGGSLATPLTAAGLIGLVLLRLSATSRGLARRRSVARATPSGHHPREGVSGGRDDA
jgi:hypothetical protein